MQATGTSRLLPIMHVYGGLANLTAAPFGVVSHRLAILAGWVATVLVAHVVAPAGSLAWA